MNDAQLRADTDMARYAAQVIENPAFAEAFDRMRRQIVEAWAECPVNETERQQFILQQMKLVDRIKPTLLGMIEQGKLAAAHMPVDMDSDLSRQSPIVRDFHRTRRRA